MQVPVNLICLHLDWVDAIEDSTGWPNEPKRLPTPDSFDAVVAIAVDVAIVDALVLDVAN